jgi:hypothetical protein
MYLHTLLVTLLREPGITYFKSNKGWYLNQTVPVNITFHMCAYNISIFTLCGSRTHAAMSLVPVPNSTTLMPPKGRSGTWYAPRVKPSNGALADTTLHLRWLPYEISRMLWLGTSVEALLLTLNTPTHTSWQRLTLNSHMFFNYQLHPEFKKYSATFLMQM